MTTETSVLKTICRVTDLLRVLGWYYDINDCHDRHPDDALEVPIKDLLAARELYRDMTGTKIEGPAAVTNGDGANG